MQRHYYVDISDTDLDDIVSGISGTFPKCGEKMTDGRLRSRGILVQRDRVRESLRRVDPVGSQLRRRMHGLYIVGYTMLLHQMHYGTWMGTTNLLDGK